MRRPTRWGSLMVEAIAERLPEIRMEIVDDMPAEPDQVPGTTPGP
ncbi:hypothetical protein [Streptomyces virginiae]